MSNAKVIKNPKLPQGGSGTSPAYYDSELAEQEKEYEWFEDAVNKYINEKRTLEMFWDAQASWSQATFGSDKDKGPIGSLLHLQKEVGEALAEPTDIKEYVDCYFLTIDAARRAGFTLTQFKEALWDKLDENKKRSWPKAEHVDDFVEHLR